MMRVDLVFVTKYHRGVFTKEILDNLRPIFASVCVDFEAELIEFDGEDDHVHLLVNYPPKVAVSKLVNGLKGIFSLLIRMKNYPSIKKRLGVALCGRPVILLEAATERQSQLFASTSNSSEPRFKVKYRCKDGFAVRAYIPALNDGVLRANPIKKGRIAAAPMLAI